jgi:hypothetical protein
MMRRPLLLEGVEAVVVVAVADVGAAVVVGAVTVAVAGGVTGGVAGGVVTVGGPDEAGGEGAGLPGPVRIGVSGARGGRPSPAFAGMGTRQGQAPTPTCIR